MASKKDGKKKKEDSHPAGPVVPKQLGDYEVYESIGKGAFGVVYRGVNIKTGETVAIKTFSSATLPQEELRSIEGEVNLMQKLKHPNIVKYIDTIRTPETLNIIIEFVEKGSLSGLRKKNGGQFPESVIALYTAQVLEGLNYLHEQGVVHRDIKGANILLARDNVIKLADFGVATQLDPSQKELSVVGTPYWMAPEVIEMSGGASTACDIWSLGCTIIELIQGEPPYFNLDPMPALFRIVQDDHPPLPTGISPVLEEFLLCCFQKEPGLRAKAGGLLKHRWISLNVAKPIEAVEKEIIKDVHVEMMDTIMGTIKIAAETMRMAALARSDEKEIPPPKLEIKKPTKVYDDELVLDSDTEDEAEAVQPKIDLNKFREDDNDDDAPGLNKVNLSALAKIKQAEKAPEKPSVREDEDPFENMGFDDKELAVDMDAKLQEEISRCLVALVPNASNATEESAAMKAIELLKTTFSEPKNVHFISKMTSKHGVLPFLEMLGTQKEDLLLATLRLVYDLVNKSFQFLQSLCLMGLIPAIDKFVRNFGYNVKMEAGKFLKLFCGEHNVADGEDKNAVKRIFIASGGLQSVVALINQKDYATYKSLIMYGVECVELVLKETTASIKSDLCRLFCKAKIIKPMVDALLKLQDDDVNENKAQEYVKKIVDLFYTFCQTGKSSARSFLARKTSLKGLRDMLLNPHTNHQIKVNILRIIQLLASEVSARDNLQQIQMIPILVNFLDSDKPEFVAQVLPAIVHLFQVNQRRQEEMALNGIIPVLQKFIQMNHHLKQFPLDLICHLSQNKIARVELKKYGGIEFYLELLEMHYWRKRALQALAVWIADDGVRVEAVLMQNHNLHRLITAFHQADRNDFFDFSKFLEKIVSNSVRVNKALGKSGKFLEHLVSKLTEYGDDNHVLRTLLSILKTMLEHSDTPKTMGKKKLDDVLDLLSKGNAVLVADAAKLCLKLRVESKKQGLI